VRHHGFSRSSLYKVTSEQALRNLLIERFWKFVKKTCLYSKYYADHLSFQQAIIECSEQAPHRHKEELASLLTLKFQSFKEVPVIGEASNICLFPVARQTKIKVSSKAA
jgi:hypothetical protein